MIRKDAGTNVIQAWLATAISSCTSTSATKATRCDWRARRASASTRRPMRRASATPRLFLIL
jgi:hypothetical protein